MHHSPPTPSHPLVSRRSAVQAGTLGLLGLGIDEVEGLKAAPSSSQPSSGFRRCIYIFLSGGLAQQDSFDLKPDAPVMIRGEFHPIATRTSGVTICEHLPGLAQRSHLWSTCRSMTHSTNGHTLGHYFMLTGRSVKNLGFKGDRQPRSGDYPSILSTAGYAVKNHPKVPRENTLLPTAAVVPETLIHWSGGTIPGQFGGQMSYRHDPWFIEASPYHNIQRGAYPEYNFPNLGLPFREEDRVFRAPNLTLPHSLTSSRFTRRLDVLRSIERQQSHLDEAASARSFGRLRDGAISQRIRNSSKPSSLRRAKP